MRPIIFYQMFELCKKVEVYNIQNNYYYYGFSTRTSPLKQKLALHLLRPAPISSILTRKYPKHNNHKKGIKLSRTMTPNVTISSSILHSPINSIQTPIRYVPRCNQLYLPNKSQLSRLRTDTEYSGHPLFYRESIPVKIRPSVQQNKKRAQQIQLKLKPNCHLRSLSNSYNQQLLNPVTFSLQKVPTQSETKNLSQTKPGSSKIQSTCTNNPLFSSQYIVSKYQPEQNNFIRQSFQNSSSKLISISKSVSSVHETSNQKDPKRYQLESEVSKSGREISINLSNIFNRQQTLVNDYRKSHRESPAKISFFWQDSDRHTIESRLSRQGEAEEADVKIEESIIQDHDGKQNFTILESNQIRKKDYVMSQALENNINMAVSLKELLSFEPRLIIEEMHVYELIEKYLSNSEQYENILQLYQVLRSSDTHILIKQPYEMSLHAKIIQLSPEEGLKLRQRAKQIVAQLLQFLEKHNVFPTRKITTHEFVFCWGQLKIHDLSFFQSSETRIMPTEKVLDGLQI